MTRRLRKWVGFCKRHRVGITLGLIMAAALWFRFWRLWNLPPGLHPDEAANGLDIFRIQSGDLRVLYNTNGPREALFFYLQAIFVGLFGNTAWALRIAPALIGAGTVGMTYLAVKQWFSRRTALLAALFTATGAWAVTLNRDGFRANLVPFFIVLFAWLITRALKGGKRWQYALAGVAFGAGFYSYLSYRFLIPALLVVGGYGFYHYRPKLKPLINKLAIFAVSTLVILAPLVIYGFSHPDEVFVGRSSVGINNPELNDGSIIKTLGQNLIDTALMFNLRGDPNYRHNLGNAPMLDAFTGLMFLLGLLISLRRVRDPRYLSLLAIFGFMLAPMVLTAEGIPHGLRAIGVIPIIYIMAAIGTVELFRRWQVVFPANMAARNLGLAILLGLSGGSVVYNYQRYFVAWANAPETYAAYSEDATAIGEFLAKTGFDGERIVVIDGYSEKTVQYLAHGRSPYRHVDGANLASLALAKPSQIIAVARDAEAVKKILDRLGVSYKTSAGVSEARPNQPLFTIYEVTNE